MEPVRRSELLGRDTNETTIKQDFSRGDQSADSKIERKTKEDLIKSQPK